MSKNRIINLIVAATILVCFATPCLAQSIAIPPKPAPAPARWHGLIGEYGTDDNLVIILERDGRLAALFKRQEASPLAEDSVKDTYEYFSILDEVSKDRFRFPPYSSRVGQLVFRRDARGRATQVQLDQDNGAVARPSGRAQYVFQRRNIEPESGNQLRIKPVRPVPELMKEARAAQPPPEDGEFRKADLVELTKLDPTIRLEIRYATTNNFLGTIFYSEGRAFMQRPAAEAVVRANRKLKAYGYGLLIHDAYRPWYVTKFSGTQRLRTSTCSWLIRQKARATIGVARSISHSMI